MIKKLSIWLLGAALVAGTAAAAATYTQGIWNNVAVCSPTNPENCLQPNSDGSLNTSGGGSGGGGAVTQGTSPWVDNITQFGGNAVQTGTGGSGAGIPRVTVSSDSSVGIAGTPTVIPITPTGTLTTNADVSVPAATVTPILSTTARRFLQVKNTGTVVCRIGYSGVTPSATLGDSLIGAQVAGGQGGSTTFGGSYVPQGTVSAYCPSAASTISVMEGP